MPYGGSPIRGHGQVWGYTQYMDGTASTATIFHELGRFVQSAKLVKVDGTILDVHIDNIDKDTLEVTCSIPMLGTLKLI